MRVKTIWYVIPFDLIFERDGNNFSCEVDHVLIDFKAKHVTDWNALICLGEL